MSNNPKLLIVSSPSGAGKTTLVKKLIANFDTIAFSVSYTTRIAREDEQDGKDYFFINKNRFQQMIMDNEFVEHETVHQSLYGTSKAFIERSLKQGLDLVFDVEGRGGISLSKLFPKYAITVFMLPPDMDVLEYRLRSRGTESEESICQRLSKVYQELLYYKQYKHIVINKDIDVAYDKICSIYQSDNHVLEYPTETKTIMHAETLIEDAHKRFIKNKR